MKKTFLYLLYTLFFIAQCTENSEKHPFNKVVYDPLLKDSFFLTDKWSYESYMAKSMDGTFDSSLPGLFDTSHQHHTANIIYATQEDESYLKGKEDYDKIRYGKAYVVGESMLLLFEDDTPSSSNNLIIKIKGGYFFTTYKAGYPAVGNIYYDFEKESLILQKESTIIGDTLRGCLDFTSFKPYYRHLKGAFKVKVSKKDYY